MRRDKFLLIALLSGFSAAILAGCAKQEVKNINSSGRTIICFGDSITFGYGVNSKEAYPAVLSEWFKIPVINSGIDGDTTSEAIKRLDSDVLAKKPLLVIIEFCGNDFLRKIPRETTISNITLMVDKIQERGAMVAIVDISAGMFLAEYRMDFRKLAQEKDAIFIPGVLDKIITNPSMKSDFLHPNAKGYRLVAERIYRQIIPYLEENKTARELISRKNFPQKNSTEIPLRSHSS